MPLFLSSLYQTTEVQEAKRPSRRSCCTSGPRSRQVWLLIILKVKSVKKGGDERRRDIAPIIGEMVELCGLT